MKQMIAALSGSDEPAIEVTVECGHIGVGVPQRRKRRARRQRRGKQSLVTHRGRIEPQRPNVDAMKVGDKLRVLALVALCCALPIFIDTNDLRFAAGLEQAEHC